MRLGTVRRRLLLNGVASLALVSALTAAGPAGAASTEELRVLQLANQLRASVGARPLVLDETLSATARRWAASVAAAGRISHNPDLPVTSSGPSAIAENVGVGPSIQMVHDVMVASRNHYDNLVNPTVTQVGIGVAWAGASVYVVQNFLIVRGATAPTSPPTTSAPAAVRASPTPSSTAAPGVPASSAPTTTVATVAPAVPPADAAPPVSASAVPSTWLTVSFEVLRVWDRTSG